MRVRVLSGVLAAVVAGGCAAFSPRASAPTSPPPPPTASALASSLPPSPARVTATPPAAPVLPRSSSPPAGASPQAWTVRRVTAADLPYSWRPGCPVPPSSLRSVSVEFRGFDARLHVGRLVVNAAAVPVILTVFRRLLAAGFPLRSVEPVDAFHGSDDASMAADNTSAFNCRDAVASGPPQWSEHAYGEAVDVDPVENPYWEGGSVHPPAGAPYLDRRNVRPGMAVPGGPLVAAFDAAGWGWGGRWSGTPDYQHFSVNGH